MLVLSWESNPDLTTRPLSLILSWETNSDSSTRLAWTWQSCARQAPPWLEQTMRDVLLGNQRYTQENKNTIATGQAQGLRVLARALPCPVLPQLDRDTDRDRDFTHNVREESKPRGTARKAYHGSLVVVEEIAPSTGAARPQTDAETRAKRLETPGERKTQMVRLKIPLVLAECVVKHAGRGWPHGHRAKWAGA